MLEWMGSPLSSPRSDSVTLLALYNWYVIWNLLELDLGGGGWANHVIRSELYYPSLYKPYFGLYKLRFSGSLNSLVKYSNIFLFRPFHKLYFSFLDHKNSGHLTFCATAARSCGPDYWGARRQHRLDSYYEMPSTQNFADQHDLTDHCYCYRRRWDGWSESTRHVAE